MYLAIDIGGTKTLIALFSERGRIIKKDKFKTADESWEFIRDLKQHLEPFQNGQIIKVVVAIPGVVQKNYSVRFGNRDWGDIDLISPIKSLFNCPVYFENDANLAALYEAHGLHGKTIFLTFSTGIGGGIVEKGRILPESASFEPGHVKYSYNGKVAEWEDIASAKAIGAHYQVGRATDLRSLAAMKDIAKRVYLGLPDIVAAYRPRRIILGGPLGKIFRLYVHFIPRGLGASLKRPRRPLESVVYGCYLYGKRKKADESHENGATSQN